MECDEDCSSDLPDHLIANILSRLPTTDAVATSVLSKDWIHKWTSIYNVDIDDSKLSPYIDDLSLNPQDDKAMFLEFLRKVLLNIQNPRGIQLRLSFTSWREYIYSREPRKLSDNHVDFVLHDRLLNTGSLRNLSLDMLTWTIPTKNHFPNLMSLNLQFVHIFNENSNTRTWTFTLPATKEIFLQNCYWTATTVEIHAPVLKSFISCTTELEIHHDYTINIFGAKLEKFSSRRCQENIILTESTVASATLDSSVDMRDYEGSILYSGLRAIILLKALSSSVKDLTLSFFLAEAVLDYPEGSPLSIFQKLGRLVLCSDGYNYLGGHTDDLFELLYVAPLLKSLVINTGEWMIYDYDTMVSEVPSSCLKNELDEIEFCILSESHVPEAIDLAKFLLGTGAQLKRFRYLIRGDQREDDIMGQLSSCPKASNNVIIYVETQEQT